MRKLIIIAALVVSATALLAAAITLGADRSLRVVDVRDQGEDEPTVLVVEDVAV